MSLLIPSGYYKTGDLDAHHEQNDLEPSPEWRSPTPNAIQDERQSPAADAETDQPTDPEARREKALKEAQAQWAQRRKDGYEDYGTEMGKEARVWETYVKETDRMDKELVEGWNKSLDVLLIFAALFSAISTAFVVVSSEGLQQDPADASAQTLLTISQALIAISNGHPANASATTEPVSFKPTRAAVIVNTLWYLSLSLSVAVSLVTMLAKEWCYSFMANRSGQMYEQGRRRQQRWNGILRWKMMDVIAFLPVVMHWALFLFALGLCVYLWSMCIPVAIPVVVTTAIALLIYFSTTVLPLLFDLCPYNTTSSKLLKSYLGFGLGLIKKPIKVYFSRLYSRLGRLSVSQRMPIRGRYRRGKRVWRKVLLRIHDVLQRLNEYLRPTKTHLMTLQIADSNLLIADGKVPMDGVTSDMLAWLLSNSEDTRVTTIALQSLAGADPWLPRLALLQNGVLKLLHQHLERCLELDERLNEYRPRSLAPAHTISLYLRGLNYILALHNSEGFYLKYQSYWVSIGASDPPKKFWMTSIENTRDLDVGAADISRLLVAGAHRSKFTLSMDSTGEPELTLLATLFSRAIQCDGFGPCHIDRITERTDIIATLGQYIDGEIALHVHAIMAVVRNETDLMCARYTKEDELSSADQLLFPIILAKLSCLPSIRKDPESLHAIAIALTVTAFVFGEYPKQEYESMVPGQALSRPSEVASYHNRHKILLHWEQPSLSLETSRRQETESLLTFGLLALLEHPDAHALSDTDIAAIAQAIESVGHSQSPSDPISYTHIHTLSETFGYDEHTKRVMERLYNHVQEDPVRNEITVLHCIRTLHDTGCISEQCSHYFTLLKCWCRAESAEARVMLFDMLTVKATPFKLSPKQELRDFLSSNNILANLDSALLLAPSAQHALNLAGALWRLAEWIYETGENSAREALRSIMQGGNSKIPNDIWSLGLVERWYPKLKSFCDTDPQMVIQSPAVQHILISFEDKWLQQRPRLDFLDYYIALSEKIVERAAERYQQDPDQCRHTPTVEAIHKIASDCVSAYRKQDSSAPVGIVPGRPQDQALSRSPESWTDSFSIINYVDPALKHFRTARAELKSNVPR